MGQGSRLSQCICFTDFWRSVPFGSTFACFLVHLGILLCGLSRNAVVRALEGAGSGVAGVKICARLVYLPLAATSLADLCALALSCLVAATREGSGERSSGCLRRVEMMAGPTSMGFVELMVKLTFLMQFLLSHVLLVVVVATDSLASICSGGMQVMEEAHELGEAMRNASHDIEFTRTLELDRYCAAARDLGSSATFFFVGAALTVIGQGGMMACVSEYMEKVCRQPLGAREASVDMAADGLNEPAPYPAALQPAFASFGWGSLGPAIPMEPPVEPPGPPSASGQAGPEIPPDDTAEGGSSAPVTPKGPPRVYVIRCPG